VVVVKKFEGVFEVDKVFEISRQWYVLAAAFRLQ
jgi:hypothetical protein